jgi:hypothetical protein
MKRRIASMLLASTLAASLLGGCLVAAVPDPPPGVVVADAPDYYDGYIVYYDNWGYPIYYSGGVVHYVPRTYRGYDRLVRRYREPDRRTYATRPRQTRRYYRR